MPELPEVEALAQDLTGRLAGRAIVTVHVPQFAALKTFDPPISALHGTLVDGVRRHGKFLDLDCSGTHLVLHLARAGWVRWRDEVPTIPPKPSSKSTLAVRIVLDDDGTGVSPGLDVTEAGTRKSLAMYVVRDPLDVPGIASLGPDPLAPEFTEEVLGSILAAEGRKQLKGVLRHQGTIAGIGNAYSDEILHAARMSPYKPAGSLEPEELSTLYAALRTTLVFRHARWKMPKRFAGVVPLRYVLTTRFSEALFRGPELRGIETVLHTVGRPAVWLFWRCVEALLRAGGGLDAAGMVPRERIEDVVS